MRNRSVWDPSELPDAGSVIPEWYLLREILFRAMKDATIEYAPFGGNHKHKEEAREWIASDLDEEFSFIWICNRLFTDPGVQIPRLRALVESGEALPYLRSQHGHYSNECRRTTLGGSKLLGRERVRELEDIPEDVAAA